MALAKIERVEHSAASSTRADNDSSPPTKSTAVVGGAFDSLNDFHPAVVDAAVQNAERQAVMVGEVLNCLAPRQKEAGLSCGTPELPADFLLELGAICQLVLWEMQGLRTHQPLDLPTADAANADLNRRATLVPESFRVHQPASLSAHVMRVWLERFAWDASELLEADVVVGEMDEDALIDALAQIIWDYRYHETT